jgi:hypothetical protein
LKEIKKEAEVSVGTQRNGRRAEYAAYGLIAFGLLTSLFWVLALGWVFSLVVPSVVTAIVGLF